jgi:hypothetical protein
MLSMGLEALIIEDINSISLKVAWDLTENIVRDKIRQEKEKHKIEQKIREEQNQLIDEIRMKYFSEYIGCRIESYNKKDLIEKINKIYPCLTILETFPERLSLVPSVFIAFSSSVVRHG